MTDDPTPGVAFGAAGTRHGARSWRGVVVGGLALTLIASVGIAADLALRACALRLPDVMARWVPTRCPVAEPSRQAGLDDTRRMLERSIDAAELRLASVRCPAPAPQPFKAAEPAPLPPAPDQGRRLVPQDIASLEGCWDLVSDYRAQSISNNEIFAYFPEWRICFDAGGVGAVTMKGQLGDVHGPDPKNPYSFCNGTSKGSFDAAGNLVIIEDAQLSCSDGGGPLRREMLCRLDDTGGAVCDSIQPEMPGYDPSDPRYGDIRFRALD